MCSLEIEFAPIARDEEAEADIGAVLAASGIRPPAAAPAFAKPGLQRHQIYPARARAGRLPAPRPVAANRRLRHRRRHSRSQAHRDLQGVSPARTGRADRARPGPRAVDRRAPRARPQSRHRARLQRQRRLVFLGDGADRESDQLHRGGHHRDATDQNADQRRPDRLHRERSGDPGRHANAAHGLGRRGHRGGRSRMPRSRRSRPRAGRSPGFWSTIISTAATASPRSATFAAGSARTFRRS